MKNKQQFILLIACLVSLSFNSQNVYAQSAGKVGFSGNPQHTSGATCSSGSCHNSGIAPQVKILGPASVLPGSTNSFKLIITGGQRKTSGLNISSDKGQLVVNDIKTYLKLNNQTQIKELTQSSPRSVGLDGNSIAWTFDWQAPSTLGDISTLYAAVVSANSNGEKTGDMGANVNFQVTVVTALPKPATPEAIITAPFKVALGEWVIFDGATSSVQDGFILNYLWEFDDGSSNTDAQSYFKFEDLGYSSVYLTVTSNGSLVAKTFIEVEVIDPNTQQLNPTAVITGPTTANSNQPVTFSTTGSTVSNTTKYYFDFGDGLLPIIKMSPTYTFINTSQLDKTFTVTLAVQEGQLTTIATTNITISPVAAVLVKTGVSLFKTNCESCHGVGGVGIINTAKNIRGATSTLIGTALTTVTAHKTNGVNLLASETQLVANFLGTDTKGTGNSLYVARCQLCHGDVGVGITGIGAKIQGTILATIQNAITSNGVPPSNIAIMAGIQLTDAQAQLIVDYVKVVAPTVTGQTIYETNCLSCHGLAGVGGSANVIVNATPTEITDAIKIVPFMKNIKNPTLTALLPDNIQLIADYLVGQLPGDALTGKITFINKCQMCHGTGTGGAAKNILRVSELKINKAIATVPDMKGLILSLEEKQDLVVLLAQGPIPKPVTGVTLFTMYCSYCHGDAGQGGAVAKITLKGLPVTAEEIKAAYSGEEIIMSNTNLINAGLTDIDLKLIAGFIK